MKKKLRNFIVACGLLSLAGFAFYQLDSRVFPWLNKVNFYYRLNSATPSKGLLASLGQGELEFIRQHVVRATAQLKESSTEFEIVGAINDYVYQLLILKDNAVDPSIVLRKEYAICGGHALAMCAMLDLVGITNRIAYMIDVPYQGGHSMVQVTFKDGQNALYDPTFGVFWYDTRHKRPLAIHDLKRNPEWAATRIFRTTHIKRTDFSQQLESFFSVADHYVSYVDHEEIHYKEMFEKYGNAGITGFEYKVFQSLRISHLPVLLGSYNFKNVSQAVSSLSLSKDGEGNYKSWLHILGKQSLGENVAHVYEFDDLDLGQICKVSLHYVRSVESIISATVVGGKFKDDTMQTKHIVLEDYGPRLLQLIPMDVFLKSRVVEIQFVASQEKPVLIISNEGEILLHAIEIH